MNTVLKLHLRFNLNSPTTNTPRIIVPIKSKVKPTITNNPFSASSKPNLIRSSFQEPKSERPPNAVTTSKDHSRTAILGAATFGLALFLMGSDHHSMALAFGPGGPLMEDFWDNMRRYALYALTVSTGAVSALFEPIVELLKNPISAVLIILLLGGGAFLVSQVVTAMVGLSDFSYDYSY